MKISHKTLLKIFLAGLALILLAGIIFLFVCCRSSDRISPEMPSAPTPSGETISQAQLQNAAHLAAGYMVRSCQKDGKFTYTVNLNPRIRPGSGYNMLRHAGAIYALAMYDQEYPNEKTRRAIIRAAGFLKDKAIAPLPDRDDLLAVWSYPRIIGGDKPVQAKLGGTGLGLVALLSLEKIEPGSTPLEDLRRMGRFLLYMQKKDGGFYSKYIPSQGGRDDSWTSLYYPGEATLGLLMLYELDPALEWLQAAADSVAYLARTRSGKRLVEADHWALLATARLLPHYDHCQPPLPRTEIIEHAAQICESMLARTRQYPLSSINRGSLSPGGRIAPTATRLEGLLAALTFLPPERESIRQRIADKTTPAILFLLRAQVSRGKYKGGFPHTIGPLPTWRDWISRPSNSQATEIRIDYVQHTLSALIQYDQFFTQSNNK